MANRKRPIKEFFYFMSYAMAGLTGCVLAFFLSLQFLTPVFSEDDVTKQQASQQENQHKKAIKTVNTFRKELKRATKIFKGILSNTFGDKKTPAPFAETAPDTPSNVPTPPPQLEGFEVPKQEAVLEPPQNTSPEGEVRPQPEKIPLQEGTQPQPEEIPPQEGIQTQPEEIPLQEGTGPQPEEIPPQEGIQPQPEEIPPQEGIQTQPEEIPPQEGTQPQPEEMPPQEGTQPQTKSPLSDSLLQLKSYMEPFLYDPSSKRRNPFEDLTKKQRAAVKADKAVKTPLEQYDLKEIKLKGIIWGVSSPKALFQPPGGGDFYTLLQGERVGKYGVIKEIREDEVEIKETVVKGDGLEQLTETRKVIKRMNRLNL